jgi:hypothetical protein
MIREHTGEAQLCLEEVHDPATIARSRVQDARSKRNNDWLQANWASILPRARGRFVAVARQEAFIADSADAAWTMAREAHPEDDGAISQYAFPEEGPRIYAYRG